MSQINRNNGDNEIRCRHQNRCQYTALDVNGGGAAGNVSGAERTSRERAAREKSNIVCKQWTQTTRGRYEIVAHLDEIGSRPIKNWFQLTDSTVRTDRLMSLMPLPADCVAFEALPPADDAQTIIMELLGSLQHPYIYPVLDLGFMRVDTSCSYACLVMPFNPRGSLKDLIYKVRFIFVLQTLPQLKSSIYSPHGTSHGTGNTHANPRVCHCRKCSDWDVRSSKRCSFCVIAASRCTVICTAATSSCRTASLDCPALRTAFWG